MQDVEASKAEIDNAIAAIQENAIQMKAAFQRIGVAMGAMGPAAAAEMQPKLQKALQDAFAVIVSMGQAAN
jgi:hypothetical protein